MKRQILVGLVLCSLGAATSAMAAPKTISDEVRTGLNLTLYSNGMALISDSRQIVLEKGINDLSVSSISPGMFDGSARIDIDGGLDVREQGFLKANLSHQELLKAHVGKGIKIIKVHPENGDETMLDATVLSVSNGLILRIGDRIETSAPGRIIFSEIPDGLRPTPVYRIVGTSANVGETDLNLSYLSNGYSWRANHALSFDDKTETVLLESRASLVNRSGFDIKNARIQVMAGNVQRRTSGAMRTEAKAVRMMSAQAAPMMADAAPPPQRQSIGGFHLYSLNGKIDLADQTTKQVTLLDPVTLPVKRMLISQAHANPYTPLKGSPRPTHPVIRLTFSNDKNAGPGQPIPGGIARLYGKDAEGRVQFLGEDHLKDLPIGAKTSINAGRAFDVNVTRTQTDYVRNGLGRNTFEMAYRIKITNGGDKTSPVQVIEAMNGDWSILNESAKHTRDNNRARWTLQVPAKGEAEITYRVRVKR
jgi:hypothetical protein